MKIIICIPAYNEEKTIGKTISDIKQIMELSDYKDNYIIHVQDDGSNDNTRDVAEQHGAIVFSNNINMGLAETFKREMRHAKNADIIVHTDADNQYSPKNIPFMIEAVERGYDLILGSRFILNGYSGSFMKKLGNKMFAKTISRLCDMKIQDTTTGFRAFNQKVARIRLINRFTYTQEQIIRARKKGYKIGEMAIKTNPTRPSRLFKSSFDYAFKAWVNILRIYRDFDPLRFFGLIGSMFIFFGFVLGIMILITLYKTGTVGGIPRTILSALLIITGIQIVLFGFMADMKLE